MYLWEQKVFRKVLLILQWLNLMKLYIVLDIVSTKKINTIATKKVNVTSTASTNCYVTKVRDCYIFHTVLLVIILLLIITIICYHYAKQKGII